MTGSVNTWAELCALIHAARRGEVEDMTPQEADSLVFKYNRLFAFWRGEDPDEQPPEHWPGESVTVRPIPTMPGEEETPWDWKSEEALELIQWEYFMYGNTDPLKLALEAGNPFLLSNPEARAVLLSLADRREPVKPGRGAQRRETDTRNARIWEFLSRLKICGMPVISIHQDGREDGIAIAAKRFNVAEGSIRRHVWEGRKDEEMLRQTIIKQQEM